MTYQGHEMYDAYTAMGDAYDEHLESMKHPYLDLYEIELADGNVIRIHSPSGTDAMEQAERACPGVAITGCREVER